MTSEVNKYSICGCNLMLTSDEPIVPDGMFSVFRSDFEKADYSVSIKRTTALPPKNGRKLNLSPRYTLCAEKDNMLYTAYYDLHEKRYVDYACKINDELLYYCYPDSLRETVIFDAVDLPSMLLKKGIGILHCSFIEYNGSAILFAGEKQVGKSTQAALWHKYRDTVTINGDRAAISFENGRAFANGIPFCGTSKICVNKKFPVKAIICLHKGSENMSRSLSPSEAFRMLLGKFTYNYRDMKSSEIMTSLVGVLCEKVPIFYYSCVKDESAVDYLESILMKIN